MLSVDAALECSRLSQSRYSDSGSSDSRGSEVVWGRSVPTELPAGVYDDWIFPRQINRVDLPSLSQFLSDPPASAARRILPAQALG